MGECKVDYLSLVEAGWEEVDIRIEECSFCGEKKLCKVMVREYEGGLQLTLYICEDCFVDDTDRHHPIGVDENGEDTDP